jgi:hypothetical protein
VLVANFKLNSFHTAYKKATENNHKTLNERRLELFPELCSIEDFSYLKFTD